MQLLRRDWCCRGHQKHSAVEACHVINAVVFGKYSHGFMRYVYRRLCDYRQVKTFDSIDSDSDGDADVDTSVVHGSGSADIDKLSVVSWSQLSESERALHEKSSRKKSSSSMGIAPPVTAKAFSSQFFPPAGE